MKCAQEVNLAAGTEARGVACGLLADGEQEAYDDRPGAVRSERSVLVSALGHGWR